MPRPSSIPEKLRLEATIRPGPRAEMRTEEDRRVPVKLFCTEKKVTEFKIVSHGDEYITVEGGGYRYRIEWGNAEYAWEVGQAAPTPVAVASWVRVGASMRYIGTEALRLTAIDSVIVRSTKLTGRFHIVGTFARHLEIGIDGVVGRFRLDLDETFSANWASAADNHNERLRPAKFLKVGRRIIPIDIDKNPVGTTSYIVQAVDQTAMSGGVMRIAPLLGDGIIGPAFDFPMWNSAEMWDVAPDDSSKLKVQAGMTVRHGDEEYEVVAVDELNKQVTVERKQRSTFRLGDPTVQVVAVPSQEERDAVPARFDRVGRDA